MKLSSKNETLLKYHNWFIAYHGFSVNFVAAYNTYKILEPPPHPNVKKTIFDFDGLSYCFLIAAMQLSTLVFVGFWSLFRFVIKFSYSTRFDNRPLSRLCS